MKEDHLKLIAKIQHFYDLLKQRTMFFEEQSLICQNEIEKVGYKEKSIELNTLILEYSKVFQEFIYNNSE